MKRTQVHLLLLLAGWLVAGSCLAQTTVEYIHTDALGSVVAVTNEAGQVIERFDYEPYGAIVGKPDYGGVGFTGHVQDAATGLTYMQQRYYDPGIGRFLSVDEITAYDSEDWRHFNVFAYAYNNPYRYTDPDGLAPPGCGDGTCEPRLPLPPEPTPLPPVTVKAPQPAPQVPVQDLAGITVTAPLPIPIEPIPWPSIGTGISATSGALISSPFLYFFSPHPCGGNPCGELTLQAAEHTKNARPSTKGKHEKGRARAKADKHGGEKGDGNRSPYGKRPPGHKGPWPPKGE